MIWVLIRRLHPAVFLWNLGKNRRKWDLGFVRFDFCCSLIGSCYGWIELLITFIILLNFMGFRSMLNFMGLCCLDLSFFKVMLVDVLDFLGFFSYISSYFGEKIKGWMLAVGYVGGGGCYFWRDDKTKWKFFFSFFNC